MRLIFSSFLIIIILFFSGCKSDESNDYIVLSTESVNYTHNGGSKEIIIECSASWTLYSDLPDWVTIDSKSGYSGKSIINISTSENTSDTARQCYLQFISGSESTLLKLTQSPIAKLEFAENKDISLNYTDTVITIKIIQNITYSIKLYSENNDWIEIENDKQSITGKSAKDYLNNNIKINISKNKTNFERSDKLIIYNKVYNLSDTLKIIQKGSIYDYYTDGDYVKLQEADKDGVNLVIMGEAFSIDELEKGGRYEHVMTQAMEYFFSIEPYKSYRKYFNVYMVIAESESSKIESGKTKFKIEFGSGTAISCNDKEIFEYASKIEELQENKPLTVIVPINTNRYAGTAYLYGDGNSIALCPLSDELPPNDFEGIIHHEAGGHAFGFLCDEYVYYDKEIPESRKNDIKEWQKLGFQMNLDFTDDPSAILWKDFIGIDKYNNVGAYEGGYEYRYGVWRPEENSCMNNNIPYYNVQSRWCIVKRIMDISGINFSINNFIENDNPEYDISNSRSSSMRFLPPLGEPVLIK